MLVAIVSHGPHAGVAKDTAWQNLCSALRPIIGAPGLEVHRAQSTTEDDLATVLREGWHVFHLLLLDDEVRRERYRTVTVDARDGRPRAVTVGYFGKFLRECGHAGLVVLQERVAATAPASTAQALVEAGVRAVVCTGPDYDGALAFYEGLAMRSPLARCANAAPRWVESWAGALADDSSTSPAVPDAPPAATPAAAPSVARYEPPPANESRPPFRFEVALSFAGDNKRATIRRIAEILRDKIGSGRVFFDEWFEHEIAGQDAQVVLQNVYRTSTWLVVTCICKRYAEKPWTQDEWRAIQSFERTLRDAGAGNLKRLRLLPLRFGDGDVDGLFDTAIVPDVRDRSAESVARLILDRLAASRAGGP